MIKLLSTAVFAGFAAWAYYSFGHLLTFESLKENRDIIDEQINKAPHLCGLLYSTIMALIIGCTCPGATTLSFIGGVLFQQPYATLYAYIGYVCGAGLSYCVVKFLLKDFFRSKFEGKAMFKKFETNIRRNAFIYLIVARFTMVFPFWFVNGMSAIVEVPFRTFITGTMVSVIPGSVIYTTAGRTLGNMLHRPDFASISKKQLVFEALTDPNVKICLAGLVVALSIAFGISRYDARKKQEETEPKKKK